MSTNRTNLQDQLDDAAAEKVGAIVRRYRRRCLWFLREDYYPASLSQAVRAMEHIERHADRQGYIRARSLKQWLLRNSSVRSAR